MVNSGGENGMRVVPAARKWELRPNLVIGILFYCFTDISWELARSYLNSWDLDEVTKMTFEKMVSKSSSIVAQAGSAWFSPLEMREIGWGKHGINQLCNEIQFLSFLQMADVGAEFPTRIYKLAFDVTCGECCVKDVCFYCGNAFTWNGISFTLKMTAWKLEVR